MLVFCYSSLSSLIHRLSGSGFLPPSSLLTDTCDYVGIPQIIHNNLLFKFSGIAILVPSVTLIPFYNITFTGSRE